MPPVSGYLDVVACVLHGFDRQDFPGGLHDILSTFYPFPEVFRIPTLICNPGCSTGTHLVRHLFSRE